jgi:Mg2+ and Co2+ transporter CorA
MLTYFRCVGGRIEQHQELRPELLREPEGDDYEGYLFIIVHGIRFDAPSDQFITRELDVFLGPNYLITHHNGPMRSIGAARDLCSKNLQAAMPKGVDFLLHQVLDQMFEHYFPSLDEVEDKTASTGSWTPRTRTRT